MCGGSPVLFLTARKRCRSGRRRGLRSEWAIPCSAWSGRFKHTDRLACHKAVQHIRTEIYFIRPHYRPSFGINLHLPEENQVLQRTEDTTAADNPLCEVEFPLCAIGEN